AGLLESSLLLLAIAASWVSVAQLARAAEVDTLQLQHHSVVPLVTWANATAWMVLALPHMVRRKQDHATGCQLLETTAFQAWHPPRFLFIALTTNFSYIGVISTTSWPVPLALHYLPASLNTAIFSSNPVFTLLLQSVFLSEGTKKTERFPSKVWSSLWTGKALSVTLSVVGVLLITEPWHDSGDGPRRSTRILGAGFSLFAALGTSIYQVYFKRVFGDTMKPEEVGLFLAHMGCWASLLLGSVLAFTLQRGIYPLNLHEVPWAMVLSSSLSSALFNFLIKFGLSRETPVTTSLGTQIGIPLNLLVDVLIVHSHFRWCQAAGVLTMLLSFSVWHHSEALLRAGPARAKELQESSEPLLNSL
ncbi:unnamed protein product, partial [Durusdinium trenchii]